MSKILYLDTNALVYAFDAGGYALLDKYASYAESSGYQLAITDVVRLEIESGPKRIELGSWLSQHGIAPLDSYEGMLFKQYFADEAQGINSDYSTKNAGDRSIAQMLQAGRALLFPTEKQAHVEKNRVF